MYRGLLGSKKCSQFLQLDIVLVGLMPSEETSVMTIQGPQGDLCFNTDIHITCLKIGVLIILHFVDL